MIYRVIIGILVVTIVLMGAGLQHQYTVITNLNNDLITAQLQATSCGTRLRNILEDQESDRQIDLIPDSGLRNVPLEWLRP